jgi:hypothetical protein
MSPPATSGTGWALFRGFDPVDLVYADYFQVTSIEVVGANGQCVAHNLPGQTGGSCRVEGPCRIGSIKLFCKANDLGRKLAVNGSTGLVVTHVNPFDATQGWYEIFINLQANCGTLSTFEISIGAHDGHAMAGAVATIIVYVECTRCDGNDGSDEDCC